MGVFTKLTKKQITDFLNQFENLPTESFTSEGIGLGTVNTYYRITFKSGCCVYLKVDEVGDENRLKNEILVFKSLIQSQKKLGFEFPLPYKSKAGKYYVPYKNKFILIFSEVAGQSIMKDLQAQHYKKIGIALASLHKITPLKSVKRHRFHFQNLQTCFKKQVEPFLPKSFEGLSKNINQRLNHLKKKQPKGLPQALIHADLFPENIIWQNNKLHGIIDYEAAGLDSVLFDLGVAFHALCLTHLKLDFKKMKQLLQGYESVRKLTVKEKNALEFYLEVTALRFLITRLKDMVIPKVPRSAPYFKDYTEYVQRLDEVDQFSGL